MLGILKDVYREMTGRGIAREERAGAEEEGRGRTYGDQGPARCLVQAGEGSEGQEWSRR